MTKPSKVLAACMVLTCSFPACNHYTEVPSAINPSADSTTATDTLSIDKLQKSLYTISIPRHVKVKGYFPFMDSLVIAYDSLVDYQLNEHILVHANPWIIDNLESYDYYARKEKGEFIEDQKETLALNKGDILIIPTNSFAQEIQKMVNRIIIDVNIPEFKLRIIEDSIIKYT